MTGEDTQHDRSGDAEVAAWLAAQRPAPPPALQRLGRVLVRRAVHERVLRRSAQVLLASGWVALVASAAIVLAR